MLRSAALVSVFFVATAAWAVPHYVTVVDAAKFSASPAESLNDGQVLSTFTEEPQAFAQWIKNAPDEKEFLTLFDGYVEPTFPKRKFSEPEKEPITMFVSKSKAVLNKATSQINLKSMITQEFAGKLDPQIKHLRVNPDQLMPVVVGKGEVKNFDWCNEQTMKKDALGHTATDSQGMSIRDHYDDDIKRPQREVDLSVLNPTDRGGKGWCNNADRSICLESCFRFNVFWRGVLYGINKGIRSQSEKKDYGVAIQSELRYFVSEAELGKRIPVAQLTGVATKVTGVLEQNMFYFNQVLQYGKVVAIFQEHPKNAGKTIVTSFIAIGLRTRSYEKYSIMKEILMGRAGLPINTLEGITAGLPVFSQDIAKKMADTLDP